MQLTKYLINFCLLMTAIFGAALLLDARQESSSEHEARVQQATTLRQSEVPGTPMDWQLLNDRLPDQSHAMQDAGYHFENLWFAGNEQNWPLASYYLRKTRSYLRLAVQIRPVRKTSVGSEVDLKAIWDAVDHGMLGQVDSSIEHQDVAGFKTSYRQTIEGCNACHTVCEKSFIRVQVPMTPSASIIHFDPPQQPINELNFK
jgi:hypothetical protein